MKSVSLGLLWLVMCCGVMPDHAELHYIVDVPLLGSELEGPADIGGGSSSRPHEAWLTLLYPAL